MSLRKRLGLVAASAVGIAVLIAVLVCYFVVRDQLRGQVDDALKAQAASVRLSGHLGSEIPGLPPNAGGPAPYAQIVLPDGSVRTLNRLQLPVGPTTSGVINGKQTAVLQDITLNGSHL